MVKCGEVTEPRVTDKAVANSVAARVGKKKNFLKYEAL